MGRVEFDDGLGVIDGPALGLGIGEAGGPRRVALGVALGFADGELGGGVAPAVDEGL